MKHLRFLIVLTLVACLFILSCSDDQVVDVVLSDFSISAPEAQGLDSQILEDLSASIQSGTYGEVHSLLIVRHGYLAYEKYYRGYDETMLHPVFSVTKSVTSALIGIALRQGKLRGIDGRLLDFFPEYTTVADLTEEKRSITLADVLTMRGGFEWNERSGPYGTSGNPTFQLALSADWIKHMLDLPMSDPPGTRFSYNSGLSVLLSGVLQNTTGTQAAEYARTYLFRPLGISAVQWESAPHNLTNTGWGLSMRPWDMAKFGYLFLRGGTLDDGEIIPESWVRASTTNIVDVSAPFGYGYQWWTMPLENVPGHTPLPDDIKIAWGYGDQFIFVIPALDMVVVSTAGNFYGPYEDEAINFLRSDIVRAVKDGF